MSIYTDIVNNDLEKMIIKNETRDFLYKIDDLLSYEMSVNYNYAINKDCSRVDRYKSYLQNENPIFIRHFKGKWYKAIGLSQVASNNKEDGFDVLYQPLYENPNRVCKSYNREINEFFSKTDKEKHPEFDQDFRFATVDDLIGQYGILKTIAFIYDEISSPYEAYKFRILDDLISKFNIGTKEIVF